MLVVDVAVNISLKGKVARMVLSRLKTERKHFFNENSDHDTHFFHVVVLFYSPGEDKLVKLRNVI